MKLNEKGQCPNCKIKPLTYKRENKYYCHRCSRAYSMDTKKQIENWAWIKKGGKFG